MASDASGAFKTTKKGEIAELREELNTPDKSKVKDAVKKVIAAMTVGKDVSMLLADVVKNGQTANLELKKLVYLYLINYAKSQPDLAILAVNTFVKDSQDANPLIRALAVRTMGCIRVDKITEYLCDPLLKTLRDDDPYVRKTAAICVAKLYELNRELVEERGFLDCLRELVGDANPMVVANAVAALTEIGAASGQPVFVINPTTLFKLLTALNECTEWGQVFILDALAGYSATGGQEAEAIVERVTPRLQHANCAVVLSAVKVVLRQLPLLAGNPELLASLRKKLAPPLVTLLSAEPEVQYVALRNINLIIQRYPSLLGSEVKVFFCKYNDPLYVKMEKLEIMVRLASLATIDAVLLEWREYATEVDVDFVRKAVRAIGRAAIALEGAAERCIGVLLELIQTKVNYVVQEAVVVIRDIFRRYPGRYEAVIGTLCENLDTLDEPEAKASMVWIVGEYAERIDNAEELLTMFAETFEDEPASVQLQLLTAVVKLFLKKPEAGPQALVTAVLGKATGDTDDPDLRDRAYIYWRLLSSDPEAARDVVLADKPVIADDAAALEPALLDALLGQLATLASVYHKPPEAFVSRAQHASQGAGLGGDEGEDDKAPDPAAAMRDLALGGGAAGRPAYAQQQQQQQQYGAPQPAQAARAAPAAVPDLLGDLLGGLDAPAPLPPQQQQHQMYGGGAAPAPAAAAAAPPSGLGGLDDLLGGFGGGPPASAAAPSAASPASAPVLLAASAQSGGLEVRGALSRGAPGSAPGALLRLALHNRGPAPLSGFLLQANPRNGCGLGLGGAPPAVAPLHPGATALWDVPLAAQPGPAPATGLGTELQLALKAAGLPGPGGVAYFALSLPTCGDALFAPAGAPGDPAALANAWRALGEPAVAQGGPGARMPASLEEAQRLLAPFGVAAAHMRPPGPDGVAALYCGAVVCPGQAAVVEVSGVPGGRGAGVRAAAKCANADAAAVAAHGVLRLLQG